MTHLTHDLPALLASLLASAVAELPAQQDDPAGREPDAAQRVERRLGAMGTWLTLSAEGPERWPALRATETAFSSIEECEARLSTWIEDSEVARFHAAPPGKPFSFSDETAAELGAALAWRERTEGAFEPACGAWLDGDRSGPVEGIELRLEGSLGTRGTEFTRLATGAWGKGAGLDAALAAVSDLDIPMRLDFGGQLARTHSEQPESLRIVHPDRREELACEVQWAWASAATSGTSERGEHIFDPLRGAPANDFGSVTVLVGADLERPCLAADALSTALFVLGPDRGLELAEELEHVEAVFLVRKSGELDIRKTSGLANPIPPTKTTASPDRAAGPPAFTGDLHSL